MTVEDLWSKKKTLVTSPQRWKWKRESSSRVVNEHKASKQRFWAVKIRKRAMKTNTPPASGPLSPLSHFTLTSATFDLLVSLVLYLETYRSFAPIVPRQSPSNRFATTNSYPCTFTSPGPPDSCIWAAALVAARLMYRRGLPYRVVSISLGRHNECTQILYIRPFVFHVRVLYLIQYR